ncbi:unnamed protein product [Cylicostephanus goldi]|uniref:Ubiquitin-like domain-containing protein n=1 Tax=Cylicostephanus goldi TaxID=71465 RepID=A0A3P6S9W1_CYLGO|nr:unnamed protein product [Cylicostephanus goldi]
MKSAVNVLLLLLIKFFLFGSSTSKYKFSIMVHELFFEIVREKQHVFCDAKDTAPVLELKRIVEGVLKIPVTDQVLVRLLDDSNTNFLPLDDKKTLAESGFTVNNAKSCFHLSLRPTVSPYLI